MIRSLVMKNAGPFRGEHRVDLAPKAYAITARYEADPGRSNWGGKSFLLEMVDYAITGRLKKSRRFDADGWIARGERDGFVAVEFEDGSTIERARRRGQATQVRFARPGGGTAAQDDAAEAVLKHLRFDADDFRNVAYFESKQMARLVHTEPEKRMEIVRGWLGIEKAERAEDRAQLEVAARVRKVQELRGRRAVVAEMLAALEEPVDEARLSTIRDDAERALREREERATRDRDAARAYAQALAVVRENAEFVDEGRKLAEEIAALPALADLEQASARAAEAFDAARSERDAACRETANRKRVSLGQFDGRCPVADIACPAKKQINADREKSKSAYERALATEERFLVKYADAKRASDDARDALVRAQRKHEQLEAMRAEAREVADAVKAARKTVAAGEPKADERLEGEVVELARAAREATAAIARARAVREQRDRLTAELSQIDERVAQEARLAAVATQTRAVFRAAQRRVSERALARIGATASAMLLGAGIDLGVEVRWEYEGKGLASSCEDCGAAFAKSAKVKLCESCGATRGQNVVRRLEFLRTDQSDAADDLAGVSLQLAAGSWLLASRESPWATAMLDEPLAACDKTNRRAIAMQLVRLLGSGTWRQSLIISHSTDTVDVFPGRIEILVMKDGSRRIIRA